MNKKALIAIIIVAVIGIGGMVGYPMVKQAMLESNPVNHILYSGLQTEDETAVDATVSLTFGMDEDKMIEMGAFADSEDPAASVKFVNTLLSRVTFDYDIISKMDYQADDLQLAAGMALNYKDITALEINANAKPWEASIEAPQMVDGPLYVDMQQILDATGSEIQLKDVDLAAYLKAIYTKDDAYNAVLNNTSAYEDVFRKLLEGKVEKMGKGTVTVEVNDVTSEVPVVQYKLNVTLDDFYGMYVDLINVAKTDENVKAFVLDRIDKVEALILENEDYAMFYFEKDDIEDGFADLKAELTDNWESALDQAAQEIMSQRVQLQELGVSQEFSNVVLSIDKKNIMRQITLDMVTEGVRVTEKVTYNAFGDAVVMPAMPTAEASRDIYEIMNDQEKMGALQDEVLTNLQSKLLSGEAVTALLSDVKTDVEMLPESEREEMVQMFDESVSGMQMMLPFMLSGMGM